MGSLPFPWRGSPRDGVHGEQNPGEERERPLSSFPSEPLPKPGLDERRKQRGFGATAVTPGLELSPNVALGVGAALGGHICHPTALGGSCLSPRVALGVTSVT